MYIAVVILVLTIGGVAWFFLANGLQQTQEGVNTDLGSDKWASEANWNSFNLANTLVNNIWMFFLVFAVIGLAYYGYVEAQRQR